MGLCNKSFLGAGARYYGNHRTVEPSEKSVSLPRPQTVTERWQFAKFLNERGKQRSWLPEETFITDFKGQTMDSIHLINLFVVFLGIKFALWMIPRLLIRRLCLSGLFLRRLWKCQSSSTFVSVGAIWISHSQSDEHSQFSTSHSIYIIYVMYF